jgi:hypothetical protein
MLTNSGSIQIVGSSLAKGALYDKERAVLPIPTLTIFRRSNGAKSTIDMPRGAKGEKHPADVIGNAVFVMRVAMTDLAEMIDASLPKPRSRGPYKKRSV